jgi:uncharacterized protein YndB with AHSA1/START domain
MTVPDRIEHQVRVDAPVERLWEVLTDPANVAGWFSNKVEIDPRPGGAAVFHFEGYGAVQAVVERAEPNHAFAYRWAREPGKTPLPGNSTLVEFTLTPDEGGTLVRVVESGFASLAGPEADALATAEDHREGWNQELDELRHYADRVAA